MGFFFGHPGGGRGPRFQSSKTYFMPLQHLQPINFTKPAMITRIGHVKLTNPQVRILSDPNRNAKPKRMTKIGMTL
jgi:hypothetical protein